MALAFPTSAGAIAIALALVVLLYRDTSPDDERPKRSANLARDFVGIPTAPRLMSLPVGRRILSLFFQFYGAFTTYLTQDLDVSQQRESSSRSTPR